VKTKHIALLVASSLVVFITAIVIILIIVPVIRAKNRTQIEWVQMYCGLNISDTAKILVFERRGGFTSDYWDNFVVEVSENEMENLIIESIGKDFKKLPISNEDSLSMKRDISNKYKQSGVNGYYFFENTYRCRKVIILDKHENKIIFDDSCH
jgi:hypothetical protein